MHHSTPHLDMVCELFPSQRDRVSRLVQNDEKFAQKCRKYCAAVEALNLLEERNRSHDAERMHEYREIIDRLEGELEAALEAASASE
jgi:hypothetical protein